MDPLLAGLQKTFSADEDLTRYSDSDVFEMLSASLVLPQGLLDQTRVTDLLLDPSTPSADVILLEINGELMWNESDVVEMCENTSRIDANLFFIQAKRSASVDTSQILNFGDGVHNFLRGEPCGYGKSDSLMRAFATMLEQYAGKVTERPSVYLHFAVGASNRSVAGEEVQNRVAKVIAQIEDLGHVGSVSFEVWGSSALHEAWTRRNNQNAAEIHLAKHVNLPAMPGVDQALLGVATVSEILKLVEASDGALDERVFYDNVRGFQGRNNVNEQIIATLKSDRRSLLPVLNNGVTIVADQYTPKPGDAIVVSGYQVVNGCQTSHCLHLAKDALGDDAELTYLPVKVVVTRDDDVATEIIRATNSQTPVDENELASLTKFQKRLEEYYKIDDLAVDLKYERRPGQFYGAQVVKTRLVSMRDQMRVVAAMFLNRPHESARYVGQLYELVGKEVFGDSHQLAPYVASAFAAYKLENAFRYDLDPMYKPIRYQMLMVYKFQALGGHSGKMESRDVVKDSEAIVSSLKGGGVTEAFESAGDFVIRHAGGEIPAVEVLKRQAFTQDLIRSLT
ncbi:AIPR family protein [Cellulosimicrobium sp. XJ-DQ-B-000]|uniref:AIPR family protein n=1 Tax=Cellulosimicrobium sp. XJ-DQ-B-000 TaxID=3072182 RepID=UPI002806F37A|nr:AIPR family protein [Cellulosimicrobium sp. XJ-DQ-B-000]MDQ8040422.1 AIPR family protein [Cellulosimicrobium sp. XJ-DQ-B-000]